MHLENPTGLKANDAERANRSAQFKPLEYLQFVKSYCKVKKEL